MRERCEEKTRKLIFKIIRARYDEGFELIHGLLRHDMANILGILMGVPLIKRPVRCQFGRFGAIELDAS